MKEYSVSIWECPECEAIIKVKTTYQGISENGIPECPECEADMFFVSESWSGVTVNDILKED